ncbi:MAG: ABC transporter permease [Blastocatellia bacterium]
MLEAKKEDLGGKARGRSRSASFNLGQWDNPLAQLTLTRLREFVREPEAVFWTFGFPIILACVLGIAFRNTAPEKLKIAVESGASVPAIGSPSDSAKLTEKIAAAISAAPNLDAVVLPPDQAAIQLRTGRVALVVRKFELGSESTVANADPSPLLPGNKVTSFTSHLTIGPSFDYQYDPTRPDSRIARLSVDDAIQRSLGRQDVAATADKAETDPGARYIDFLIPGLIGLNLMGSGMWGLGFAVVQARTRKLLKRFAATPMRRSHYLFSFMLSRLVFLVLEVIVMVTFGWAVFKVPVRGSLAAVGLISLIGALSFAGIGMLVASRPKTIEGVSGIMNLVMLPMWLLSGTFFSYSRFPKALQPAIKALPLTAVNDSLRAVMNDGAGLATNWVPIVVLVAWGSISFLFALKLFKWQ